MSKKIYFCGSMCGGRDDAELYRKIIEFLKSYGTVLTEHVGGAEVDMKQERQKDPKVIHNRDMEWMQEADVIIAEVTQPSLGVGYEIGRAVALKKPILCLFRPDSGKKLSGMIDGAHDGKDFIVKNYKELEFQELVEEYFATFHKC